MRMVEPKAAASSITATMLLALARRAPLDSSTLEWNLEAAWTILAQARAWSPWRLLTTISRACMATIRSQDLDGTIPALGGGSLGIERSRRALVPRFVHCTCN